MGQDVERLLQAIPIQTYIERVVPLKKRGSNYIGLCPFHSEKTPSFTVSPDKGIYKCFGCGAGGNLITFVQEYDKVSFREALEILSRYSGIELEKNFADQARPQRKKKEDQYYAVLKWVQNLYRGKLAQCQSYLSDRKVTSDSSEHFMLGYAPDDYHFLEQQVQSSFQESKKIETVYEALLVLGLLGRRNEGGYYNRFRDRLIFPIFDLQERVVGFGGRQVHSNDKVAKYINSSESEIFSKKNILFHMPLALEAARKNKQMIVVEGYFDVLGLYQQGITNVVGSMGTAFGQEHARLLQRFCDKVILFFDGDNAGMEAAFKTFSLCKQVNLPVRVVTAHAQKEKKLDPFDLSLSLDNFELLQMLDNSKSERDFIFWYFFSYRHNISRVEEKALAIDGFFEFLHSLGQEWEKEEYLKKASPLLQISHNSLLRDFQRGKPALPVSAPKVKPRQEILMPQEKDFILILLRYSEFWQMSRLLEQMHWQSQKLYLLYSFFRDRALIGDFFSLQESASIVQSLPADLASLFTDIAAREENTNENGREFSVREKEAEKKNHERVLKSIIWRSCVDFYRKKSESLQHDLEELERLNALSEQEDASAVEELTIELKNSINQKEHYLNLLRKESGRG